MQDLATSGSYLLLGFSPTQYMSIDVTQESGDAALYSQTGDWQYVAYSGTEATKYKRYIQFAPVQDGGSPIPMDKLLKVTSVVHYAQGADTGYIQLESFI